MPECFAHGAIRQVSEAHECEKANSAPEAAKDVKEEDANADGRVARRQRRKAKKEAAAAREAAREAAAAREAVREDYHRVKHTFDEWELLKHIENGQELKERHASYPRLSDEQMEVEREILNKLNGLGLVPNAIAIYLELAARPMQVEQPPKYAGGGGDHISVSHQEGSGKLHQRDCADYGSQFDYKEFQRFEDELSFKAAKASVDTGLELEGRTGHDSEA